MADEFRPHSAESIHNTILQKDYDQAHLMLLDSSVVLQNDRFEALMDDVAALTKNSKAPDLYFEKNNGAVTDVWLNDAIVFDTKIYDVLGGTIEPREHFKFPTETGARKLGEQVVEHALSLPKDQRYKFLTSVRDCSEERHRQTRRLPQLRVVFSDQDGDGKREELSDLRVALDRPMSRGWSGAADIDVYDP